MNDPLEIVGRIKEAVRAQPGLRLVVLFGSRARQEPHDNSDWDFGFLGADTVDIDMLQVLLSEAVGSERVDLVNLDQASGLLRYRAAQDGVVIIEHEPGAFETFWLDAVGFWCDAAPILQRDYESVLAELKA